MELHSFSAHAVIYSTEELGFYSFVQGREGTWNSNYRCKNMRRKGYGNSVATPLSQDAFIFMVLKQDTMSHALFNYTFPS